MGQIQIYPDSTTREREKKRRYRKTKKPYYAKQQTERVKLTSLALQEVKAVQGVYDVIVIDPPWPVHIGKRALYPTREGLSYPTMKVEAIAALSIPCADDCHVWLWTTHGFLPDALACLQSWGLRYLCCFTWLKPDGMQVLGLPKYNTELVLYARKGKPIFVDTKQFFTNFAAPRRGGHSAKPDEFYAMVRRVTAGRRLDMFGRRSIEGFDSWGAEAPGEGERDAGNMEGAL